MPICFCKMDIHKIAVFLCVLMMVAVEKSQAYRVFPDQGKIQILAQTGETVKILCQADEALLQCGITGPDGALILSTNMLPGASDCSIELNISETDEGAFICSLWPQLSPEHVTNKTIDLRIVEPVTSVLNKIVVNKGDTTSLTCVTTGGVIPLDHCFFISPLGEAFRVGRSLNKRHLQSQKYQQQVNKSMDRGDCAITLNSVEPDDSGVWLCNVWIEHEVKGYTSSINLIVQDDEISSLSPPYIIITVSTCILILTVAVLSFILYKKIKRNKRTQENNGRHLHKYGYDNFNSKNLL